MLTSEQVQSLKLGITPINEKAVLIVESGLEWVKANTTLEFDLNNEEEIKALPSSVRLFLLKFFELNKNRAGVSSESISGLSQSFNSGDISVMIWQIAEELLYPYMKSRVTFISASNRWE